MTDVVLPDGRSLEVIVTGPAAGLPLVFHLGTPASAAQFAAIQRAATEQGTEARHVVPSRIRRIDPIARPQRRRRRRGHRGGARSSRRRSLPRGRLVRWRAARPCVRCPAPGPGHRSAGRSPAWRRTTRRAWTGSPGWGPATSTSTQPPRAVRLPCAPTWTTLVAGRSRSPARTSASPWQLCCLRLTSRPSPVSSPTTSRPASAARSSNGIEGWLDDDLAFLSPWGFAPADVTVPTFLWHGLEDLAVPVAHGRWLAAHLPNVTAHLEPGDGHLSVLVGGIGRMLDELVTLLHD